MLFRYSMTPSSSELIDAVSHPTRRRILRTYLDGPVECISAGDLAPTVEQQVGHVAYHLKTLARCELLRPVQGGGGRSGGRGSTTPQEQVGGALPPLPITALTQLVNQLLNSNPFASVTDPLTSGTDPLTGSLTDPITGLTG